MVRIFWRMVLRHRVPPISREEEASNIVSKLNGSQWHCASTLGPPCLDEQPLQCFVTHHGSIFSVTGHQPCGCEDTACAAMR